MPSDLDNHYTKGRSTGSKWNFDLAPLIKDFSFYDFCYSSGEGDHGAFLVVTDRQYIIGYTAGFGSGSHMHALGRVHKELLGGGDIDNPQDGIYLSSILQKMALTGRITYEPYVDKNERIKYSGRIIIDTDSIYTHEFKISPGEFEHFMEFYNDYNEEISLACTRFNLEVEFIIHEGEHYKKVTSKSLDEAVKYLKTRIREDYEVLPEEVILDKHQVKQI